MAGALLVFICLPDIDIQFEKHANYAVFLVKTKKAQFKGCDKNREIIPRLGIFFPLNEGFIFDNCRISIKFPHLILWCCICVTPTPITLNN